MKNHMSRRYFLINFADVFYVMARNADIHTHTTAELRTGGGTRAGINYILVVIKQAVWPPGSADTVCPRQPLTVTFDRLTLKLACESHLHFFQIWAR